MVNKLMNTDYDGNHVDYIFIFLLYSLPAW